MPVCRDLGKVSAIDASRKRGTAKAEVLDTSIDSGRRNGEDVDAGHLRPGGPQLVLRGIALVLLVASAALFIGATVVGYHNVVYSAHRIPSFFQDKAAVTRQPTSDDVLRTFVPPWARPFMKDLSLVSPTLVAFTAGWMMYGAILLLLPAVNLPRISARKFPFPSEYKTYYVQMGLLGTIIGFIIAFSDVDLRAERQSLVLMSALGTALWSTFTAITLAYAACPLIEVPYRWLATRRSGGVQGTPFENLRLRAFLTAEAFDELAASAQRLGEGLDMQSLGARMGNLEARIATLREEFASLRSELSALQSEFKRVASEIATYDADSQARTEANAERFQKIEQRLGKLLTNLKKASE